MKLFPMTVDLRERRVLVIGAGTVAQRKIERLLGTGAHIHVAAPRFSPQIIELSRQGMLTLSESRYTPHLLDDAWLVIAATNDSKLHRVIARDATQRRVFVNVVDEPSLCSFQSPSVVERGPLTIAISSSGHAPVIARRLRERIETLFDPSLGALVSLAARYRRIIRTLRPDLRQRRQFYDWLLNGPVTDHLKAQHIDHAEHALLEALHTTPAENAGKVSLVGAGPGDPGLLTLKALRALNEADVVLYDRLVDPAILDLARRDANFIPVGKQPGENHDLTQQRIHALLLEHARQGRHVVRLKGGDAFVFGRGGEELEFLKQHGIHYEVVPGLTAALACTAYAGIPLTHRDHAQTAQLVTAHCQLDGPEPDWPALARAQQTLALYMGVSKLEEICSKLMKHGRAAHTPAALIENGTRPTQRAVYGTLGTLAAQADQHRVKSPAIIIIGEVAELGPKLAWFGQALTLPEPTIEAKGQVELIAL